MGPLERSRSGTDEPRYRYLLHPTRSRPRWVSDVRLQVGPQGTLRRKRADRRVGATPRGDPSRLKAPGGETACLRSQLAPLSHYIRRSDRWSQGWPSKAMPRNSRSVISLFSGALGLDLGLEAAGFDVRVAVERNRFACETIRANRPDLPLIDRSIEDVHTTEILEAGRLEVGEPTLLTAGPCCQAFSTAGQRASLEDPRGVLFRHFLRVVREARPRFFVMENVRGILSAAIRHRPLKKRGPGFPPLQPDEELGSAFSLILRDLESLGYYVVFGLLNAADYGVPQTRERVVFIGSRDLELVKIPSPTHREAGGRGFEQWVTLRDALAGLRSYQSDYTPLSPRNLRYLERIPAGGNWRSLPKTMQERALGGAYRSWGGRTGFLRRLSWHRPSPSLPTRPDSRATMLCHPRANRPLSVKEYARLQQFPDDWQFSGGLPQQYKQIGNAVPVGLGVAVGVALRETMRSRARADRAGVRCADPALLERMARRPKTILNPPRMRRVKRSEAVTEWRNGSERNRTEFLGCATVEDTGS